jgi:5-methylcytosine-specific restriction enzyme A
MSTEAGGQVSKRTFRTEQSIAVEQATRGRVEALLLRHGFTVTGRDWIKTGSAIIQVVEARRGDAAPMRIHVRLCWRRDGRNASEHLYSAAQLTARLESGGWQPTLAQVVARHARERHTHILLAQDSPEGFVFAALVPSAAIGDIWTRQRDVSADLLARGLTGRLTKNHAANGSSPTLWLQDDRHAATPAVAQVLWEWPGVVNILALPVVDAEINTDTIDDLGGYIGRDGADRERSVRSGYPRDPKVRAAVRERARGQCERDGCGEHRAYPGFLDVHHILGIEVSDRFWTCVALCPNCHREAHFAPDRDAINAALAAFAARFRVQ